MSGLNCDLQGCSEFNDVITNGELGEIWDMFPSDLSILNDILVATQNRIHHRLCHPEQINCFRIFIAILKHRGFTVQDAYSRVLALLHERIGKKPDVWMSDWSMIGKPIAYDDSAMCPEIDGDLYQLVETIKFSSSALLLDDSLLTPAGLIYLRKMARQYGIEAMYSIPPRLDAADTSGDMQDGDIKSWRYFENSVKEEISRLEQQEYDAIERIMLKKAIRA